MNDFNEFDAFKIFDLNSNILSYKRHRLGYFITIFKLIK